MRIQARLIAPLCVAGIFGSSTALAGSSCIDDALNGLGTQIKKNLLVAKQVDASIRPAQVPGNGTAEQGQEAFVRRVQSEMARAAQSFISSNGDITRSAQEVLGDGNKRSSVQIHKKSSPVDVTLDTKQIYVVEGSSARQVVDRLSQHKLATEKNTEARFCEVAKGCQSDRDFAKSSKPAPMKLNTPYLVEEIVDPGPVIKNIRNTAVYQVTEISVCGKPAYIVTAALTGRDASFDTLSTYALVLEDKGRTMVFGHFQGQVADDRGPVSLIFGGYPKAGTEAVNQTYNDQAVAIGAAERVTAQGMLEGAAIQTPLADNVERSGSSSAKARR